MEDILKEAEEFLLGETERISKLIPQAIMNGKPVIRTGWGRKTLEGLTAMIAGTETSLVSGTS